MKKIKLLFGFFLVILFDMAMGIFIVILASKITGEKISGWEMWKIFLGIFFSLLPDMDMAIDIFLNPLYKLFGKNREKIHKKSISHRPLPMLLITAIIFPFSLFWAIVYFFCLFLHYLHDTEEEGEGIAWLWPFNKKHYLFLKGKLCALSSKQLAYYFSIDEKEWIRSAYLCWKPRPIVHVILFLAALVISIKIIFF